MTFRIIFTLLISLFFLACAKQPEVDYTKGMNMSSNQNIPSVYDINKSIKIQNNAHLEAYLQEVIYNNNNLKALELNKKLFKLNIKITREDMYPSGSLDIRDSRTKTKLNTELASSVNTSLLMSWDLDVWGKLTDETKAVEHAYINAQNQYLEQKRLLVLNASIDWINYWYLSQVLENQLVSLNTYTKITSHYLEESKAGLNDRYFYLQARRAKELVRSSIFTTRLDLIKILQQLNIYRGSKPDATLEISHDYKAIPISIHTQDISAISLSKRYDIKSSFALFKSAVFSEKASYKALLPQLNLSLSANKNSNTISDIFSGEVLWELIGGISQPIFHADQLHNIAKSKSVEAEIAWWQYQESILQAFLEVESIIETDKSLNKQLQHKNRFYTDLEESLKVSKYKTLEGIFDFGDYLQEKADIIDEKNSVLEVKTQYIKNRLRLISALGLTPNTKENINEN